MNRNLAIGISLFFLAGGWLPCQAMDLLINPSPDVPMEWLTPAEKSGFRETPRFDETVEYCRRLAEASDWIDFQIYSTSPEGRATPLLIMSKNGHFSPRAAHESDHVVVLVQNAIHAGECGGKDASLMLMRDLAVTKTRSQLLDRVVLLVIPIFSADGHERFSPYSRINQNGPAEMGWRVTSRNLNLNRDHMKADSKEMRDWLSVWNAWRPDLHFDNHTTDGGNWQYDLTFATDRHDIAAPQVAAWLDDVLYPPLWRGLESDGHIAMTYFSLVDSRDPSKGIRSGGFGPRYSTGYAALRNRPSFLVETHMLKPYRTRVFAHYNIMKRVLEIINKDPDSLRNAVRQADADTVAMGSQYRADRALPIRIERTDEPQPIQFKGFAYRREHSEVSGEVRIIYNDQDPLVIPTVWYNKQRVNESVAPPLGYLIPPQWTEVIEIALAHGLRCERLLEPVSGTFETYRFKDVTFPRRPFEGRFEPRFKTLPCKEKRAFVAGSVFVPTNQPDGKVAIFLFEPQAPDSLLSWGLFNAIFEQKEYAEHFVAEELARAMLNADARLKAEFEDRLQHDADFAASPHARLQFFYRRSPYWDDRKNAYPIVRVTEPIQVKTQPLK